MGKAAKEHRKKVEKRNLKLTERKNQIEKHKRELRAMIEKEIKEGKFSENQSGGITNAEIIEVTDADFEESTEETSNEGSPTNNEI